MKFPSAPHVSFDTADIQDYTSLLFTPVADGVTGVQQTALRDLLPERAAVVTAFAACFTQPTA